MIKCICFSIANFSNCGGTERVCEVITRHLCSKGYDIHVLSQWGDKPYFKFDKRVHTHQLISKCEKKFAERHPKYMILRNRIFYSLHHFDLIVDVGLGMSNTTIPAIKNLNVKHLSWDHFSYYYYENMSFLHAALDKVKKYSNGHIVLTRKDRELYVEKQKENPEKIFQIYNPLTFQLPAYKKHNSKTVIALGRFSYEKGFDMLLKAWKHVEAVVDDWNLQIWGYNGEDSGKVFETFNELQLRNASLHHATTEIQKLLESASMLVLPSRHEGLGLVLLEASAYSLAPIAFDCPNGPREVISNGENGVLVPPEDVEALAHAIIHLINNTDIRQDISYKAYLNAGNFSVENIISQWDNLIQSI